MSEWRPIETAPKDGTLILLYPMNGDGMISTGRWCEEYQNWPAGRGWFEQGEVSHWMPLPAPPNANELCGESVARPAPAGTSQEKE